MTQEIDCCPLENAQPCVWCCWVGWFEVRDVCADGEWCMACTSRDMRGLLLFRQETMPLLVVVPLLLGARVGRLRWWMGGWFGFQASPRGPNRGLPQANGNANPAPRPAPRNLGNYQGTGEVVPFVHRTFEWGVAIATCLSNLSPAPHHCARLTYFLHPELRNFNVMLIVTWPIPLPLRRLRSAGSFPNGPPDPNT